MGPPRRCPPYPLGSGQRGLSPSGTQRHLNYPPMSLLRCWSNRGPKLQPAKCHLKPKRQIHANYRAEAEPGAGASLLGCPPSAVRRDLLRRLRTLRTAAGPRLGPGEARQALGGDDREQAEGRLGAGLPPKAGTSGRGGCSTAPSRIWPWRTAAGRAMSCPALIIIIIISPALQVRAARRQQQSPQPWFFPKAMFFFPKAPPSSGACKHPPGPRCLDGICS